MRIALVLGLLALAGCGADGDPIRPTATTSVTMGTSGVGVSTGVKVRKGPVTVGVTL